MYVYFFNLSQKIRIEYPKLQHRIFKHKTRCKAGLRYIEMYCYTCSALLSVAASAASLIASEYVG